MVASAPFVARWGIIGTGWISSEFCKDAAFVRDDVTDVLHSIVAVGSRDTAKAQAFIDEFCPKGGNAQVTGVDSSKPKAVGSYDAVFTDPDVDIIYIATPNTYHFANAQTALNAGKHTVVEKPATLNANEWAVLAKLAKEKNLFLMEAVWTRFLPLTVKLMDLVHKENVIGDVRAVHSDFAMDFYGRPEFPLTHRVFNTELAGGAMYDLGPYTILPALLYLYHSPANELAEPENLIGTMMKAETGADLSTNITMDFPKLKAQATSSSSFAYCSDGDHNTVILGTKGTITLSPIACRPTKAVIRRYTTRNPATGAWNNDEDEVLDFSFPNWGLYFEADAVARSIRDGEKENSRMPVNETALTLKIFDTVRKQNNYLLPKGLEAYPL